MHQQTIVYTMFVIFAGTAVLSTLALFTRQSLLVAYMLLGAILGPFGLKLINDPTQVKQAGDIGIIFLLFLLGLHLQPQSLLNSIRKMSLITIISSVIFLYAGFLVGQYFGFATMQCVLIGITSMFSSTIIGLKLLPTTVLHHQHTGELMISILLLQDMIAIAVLLILQGVADRAVFFRDLGYIIGAFPTLLLVAFLFQRYLLSWLLSKYDRIQEYIFILSIGWCLCMAELSSVMHLSEEIGAFIAGVTLASNPICFYIAENLKPLRDFFLVIFFFSVGATFNFAYLPQILWPALTLALLAMLGKPLVFNWLLRQSGEPRKVSWEIGVRLAQMSEFSLLVIYLAVDAKIIQPTTNYLIQAATILTFVGSCYWVTMRYPTPMAMTDKLRRD